MSKTQDLEFGKNNEINSIDIISKFLNTKLNKTQNQFSTFDFTNQEKNIYVELKSRRIKHNQYPTALIGLNKIKSCNDPNIKYYIFYKYEDGLFYIEYEEKLFKTFSIDNDYQIRLRKDVNYNEISKVVKIPYSYLKKVEI